MELGQGSVNFDGQGFVQRVNGWLSLCNAPSDVQQHTALSVSNATLR